MSKKLLIVLVIAVLTLSLILFFFWQGTERQPLVPVPESDVEGSPFPISAPNTTGSGTILIRTENGETIRVKDFFQSSNVVEDSINPGLYYLGQHFVDGQEQRPTISYVISYTPQTNFFNIALYKEPLGRSRKEAEQSLMSYLGISQSQMCDLRYTVSTPNQVNQFYAGVSLIFSFCPGSVQIPE